MPPDGTLTQTSPFGVNPAVPMSAIDWIKLGPQRADPSSLLYFRVTCWLIEVPEPETPVTRTSPFRSRKTPVG